MSYSDNNQDGVINSNYNDPAYEIRENKAYYPFGLTHNYGNTSPLSVITAVHPYGFGGKELNQELGLDWYDVSARNYDPALGRWMNLDPLAEKMRRHSPYNFGFDNPIYFQDYDGMMPTGPGDGDPPPSIYDRVVGFFSEMFQDADSLASSGGTDTGASSRLAEKSDLLTKLDGAINAYADAAREVVENLPFGEELAAAGDAVITGDVQGAVENYATDQVNDAPYTAVAAAVPFVSKKAVKATRKQITKVFSTRKRAKDARPKPKPLKKGQKRVTRQTRNKKGEGNKLKTDGGSQTPHFHDANHNNKKKPNMHYRIGTNQIKPN